MPELAEVEAYRRLAGGALGRPIRQVAIPDPRYVRGPAGPRAVAGVLRGASFRRVWRHGKLLVLEVDAPGDAPGHHHRLGLRFGMTGRLLLDGQAAVDQLLYASNRQERRWDRFTVRFTDGGTLVVHDPRLLGGVVLDPDESTLGPDALSVTVAELAAALAGSPVALKSRLLDQRRVAGIGNLAADEILWRAGLAPQRASGSLHRREVSRLQRDVVGTMALLVERGGSHTGDLVPHRLPGGRCPRDGTALVRSIVGGRTTWWCPRHQR